MSARTLDVSRLGLAVERCYDAVILPDLWPSVFQEFAEAVNATGMISFQFGADTQKNLLLCSPSLDESTDAYVKEGWFLRNPRIVRASRVASPDRLVSDRDLALVRDSLDDADRAWRHDFLQRQGLGWFAGTDFFYNGGMNRVGISVERSVKVEPFQEAELAIIYLALAQIRRALALAPALDDAAANGLLNGLESSGHAAGLLDRSGRIILLNARAERLIGKTIRLRDGYLTVDGAVARQRLQRFIASLVRQGSRCDDDPDYVVMLPSPNGRPLIMRGAPIAPIGTELFKRAKAFITFAEAGQRVGCNDGILRDAFGLTPAEAKTALAIAKGRDCEEIATLHNVSIATVRTHLKAIFAKTGTRRQAALAVLIAGLNPI